MARKKNATEPPAVPAGVAVQKSVINLKGSDDQREWMSRATRKTHIPAATITRLALDLWGKANGIGPFPGVEAEA